MGRINVQYLGIEELETVHNPQRTTGSRYSTFKQTAMEALHGVGTNVLELAPGILTVHFKDEHINHVQVEVERRLSFMVPRGEIVGVMHTPTFDRGAGI